MRAKRQDKIKTQVETQKETSEEETYLWLLETTRKSMRLTTAKLTKRRIGQGETKRDVLLWRRAK